MSTKKGYSIERQDNSFFVRERRLCFDPDEGTTYVDDHYHSELSVYVGLGKDDCWALVSAWLGFFDDPELLVAALPEVEALFDGPDAPTTTFVDDDKTMN